MSKKDECTCNTSLSSASSRQLNRLGARCAKKPSPRPDSGLPRIRLVTRSIADPATHDSLGLAFAIAVHRVGSDCFTTISYTPLALEAASDCIMSVKIERNRGSVCSLIERQSTQLNPSITHLCYSWPKFLRRPARVIAQGREIARIPCQPPAQLTLSREPRKVYLP